MAKKKKQKPKSKPDLVQPAIHSKKKEPLQRKSTWLDAYLKPYKIFTVLAFIFGICFMVTTPPFQVPDEIAHFDRVFTLSEFRIKQKIENNISGDYIPRSLDSMLHVFRYLSWRPDQKVEKAQILHALKAPLENEKRKFTQIDAGPYFYVSYLPQFPAMLLGKLFNMNVLYILYLGRFFALLFFIYCVRYALKIIPIAKYLMLTIALLPICLAQAASYNADCVLFSLTFLCLAIILKITFSSEKVKMNREMLLLLSILITLGVMKSIYLPMTFLLLIIPKLLYDNRSQYYRVIGLTVLLSAAFTIGWLLFDAPGPFILEGINPSAKIKFLLHDPLVFLDIVGQTMQVFHELYYKTTIGVLGYLDTYLSKSTYITFTILILFLALFEADKSSRLSIYQRVILMMVSISVFLITILAMYLYSREASGLVAEGIQGRYFIPVVIPFFLTFYGLIPFQINLSKNRILAIMLYLVIIILLYGTVLTIINRYFG